MHSRTETVSHVGDACPRSEEEGRWGAVLREVGPTGHGSRLLFLSCSYDFGLRNRSPEAGRACASRKPLRKDLSLRSGFWSWLSHLLAV